MGVYFRIVVFVLLSTGPGPGSLARAAPVAAYWLQLAVPEWPERERIRDGYRFKRAFGATDLERLDYLHYREGGASRMVGFVLKNRGSPRINPAGLRGVETFREYRFLYPDRARENLHLSITDDVAVSGRYSQDNMFREWHFFPRRLLPAVEIDRSARRARVTLPTGEGVEFDLDSMEILAGALQEEPIDRNRDRHARHNPRVRYRGEYLAITVAQRGESARRARVWGRAKKARVHYPSRYPTPCEISPGLLWDQSSKPGDQDPRLTMLHPDDAALFDLIERHCGWDLGALRRPVEVRTRLAKAAPPDPVEADVELPPVPRRRPAPAPSWGGGFEH